MQTITIRWEVGGSTQSSTVNLEGSLLIGRQSTCDITIPHQTVSRQHARIELDQGSLLIHNLSSTNPIRHEEREIPAGKKAVLCDGDTFHLGMVSVHIAVPETKSRLKFKIRCTTCGKVVDSDMADCPWCGTSLAFGETFIPISGDD